MEKRMGPLAGIRIVEFQGIGPGPFAAMLLSDMGADGIRIDRKGGRVPHKTEITYRGRRSVALDMKKPEAVEAALKLIEKSDALLEGFRPGVMERLGVGPDVCLRRNPRLVYGRMTGWGQTGPLAHTAGHDINYIAISGALHAVGLAGGEPVVPLNLVGDFGGGGMLLAFGVVAAILRARSTGEGCVVDAAMTDGAAMLMSMMYGFYAAGHWQDARGTNLLDGGAPFYRTYRCADGRYIAVGALEPKFSAELLSRLGIGADDDLRRRLYDPGAWPELRSRLGDLFRTRTRDEWSALLEGTDACAAPVLSLGEAPTHPHNVARGAFTEVAGLVQPAPAPRFSATPGGISGPAPEPGRDTGAILDELGYGGSEIEALRAAGAVG